MRIEPAPSPASAAPTRPAATAAALPPLEPPGRVLRDPTGCASRPRSADSVNGQRASSGTCVLPMITAPASRSAAHDLRVRARGLAVGVRAERRHLAGHVDVVLDRDRHAQQRALGRLASRAAASVGLVGLHPRALGEHDPERVQPWVEARDPLQVERRPARVRRSRPRRSARPAWRSRRRRGRRRPSHGNLVEKQIAHVRRRARIYGMSPREGNRTYKGGAARVLSRHLRSRLRRATQPADDVLPADPVDPAGDLAVRVRDRRRRSRS